MATATRPSPFSSRKYRPVIKCHGGKNYLARRFLKLFPAHRVFVEPFAGGLSVLLNKHPSEVEVANDIDEGLMLVYAMLQDRPADLISRLSALEYTAETFAWACRDQGLGGDEVEAAARYLVRRRFSRGGLGKDFAWSKRKRGGQPGDKNGWETILREMPRIADRLAHVELRCGDAIEVIKEFDGPDTFHYLDPPYVHTTRTAPNIYTHEMSDADHRRLLGAIVRLKGSVAISGYANPMYEALRGWERHTFDLPLHAGQTTVKQRRVEVLWLRVRG